MLRWISIAIKRKKTRSFNNWHCRANFPFIRIQCGDLSVLCGAHVKINFMLCTQKPMKGDRLRYLSNWIVRNWYEEIMRMCQIMKYGPSAIRLAFFPVICFFGQLWWRYWEKDCVHSLTNDDEHEIHLFCCSTIFFGLPSGRWPNRLEMKTGNIARFQQDAGTFYHMEMIINTAFSSFHITIGETEQCIFSASVRFIRQTRNIFRFRIVWDKYRRSIWTRELHSAATCTPCRDGAL